MKLCIDPGHGMSNKSPGVYDPGVVVRFPTGSGAAPIEETEAGIVLQVGLTLKWVCAEYGMPYWMTRIDDRVDAALGKRDERAKRECCTHFLSLHCNAGGGSGTETYYRDARDRAFADVVHRCAIEAWALPDRGVRHESLSPRKRLSVMDFPHACCLLEIGFLDSPGDLARMKNRDMRIRFARLLMRRLMRQ